MSEIKTRRNEEGQELARWRAGHVDFKAIIKDKIDELSNLLSMIAPTSNANDDGQRHRLSRGGGRTKMAGGAVGGHTKATPTGTAMRDSTRPT